MIISEELAQRIVDSAMLLVHRNVNIMNRDGVIIATGHPHRRLTFHKGAKDVIETGMVIEIYPDQLERFPGALQGVNLPIVFDEQIVGVVGVFGVPEEVRDTGRLVKAITELILERELMQEETRSRYKLREQFLENALSGDVLAALPKLKRLAKAMSLNLLLPRAISITGVASFMQKAVSGYGSSELVLERSMEAILKHLEQSGIVCEQDIAVIWEEKLIILKTFPTTAQTEQVSDWGNSLLKSLHILTPEITCCGIGGMVDNICSYVASYQQALYCLTTCCQAHPLRIISDRQLLVGYTLVDSIGDSVTAALAPLTQKFHYFLGKKSEGRKTLEALLASNLNLSNAANALHIHRNTLMFRLEQLHSITGLDPAHNFEDAVLCRILLEQNAKTENAPH